MLQFGVVTRSDVSGWAWVELRSAAGYSVGPVPVLQAVVGQVAPPVGARVLVAGVSGQYVVLGVLPGAAPPA